MAHSDSDLSSLSSAPPTDDEADMAIDEPVGIAKYFKKESETPPPKREPSPPHEYVLADNPNIAVSYGHFEWLRSISGSLAISMTR
jgi:hypothetical protein